MDHKLVGELRWSDGKNMHVTGFYDRIAISRKRLLLLSFVGPANQAKAMRAGLATDKGKYSMTLEGETPKGYLKREGVYADSERGYAIWIHKMPYGLVHALFIARDPGLLMNSSDEALWAALKDPRYTTPLLRDWLPYLKDQLENGQHASLFDCACVGCQCRVLVAQTRDLDEIVSTGIRNGSLLIREEVA